MKKVMLSALIMGMFMIGSVYAQTTAPATPKSGATKQESTSGAKTDKPAKGKHKGKGKGKGKAASSTNQTKPANQK